MNFTRIWFCISILNLICWPCIAQDSLHWKVGIWAGPNYSYRTLKGSSSTAPFIIELRNKNEKPMVGIETGISISRSIASNWWIISGIQFSEVGEKTLPLLLLMGPFLKRHDRKCQARYHYQSIEVPLAISYSLLKGNLKIEPSVGIGLSKFYNEHYVAMINYYNGESDTTIKTNSSTVEGNNKFSNFNFFGTIQARIDYKISRRIELYVAPELKYYFVPLVKDVPIKEYNYSGRGIAGIDFRW